MNLMLSYQYVHFIFSNFIVISNDDTFLLSNNQKITPHDDSLEKSYVHMFYFRYYSSATSSVEQLQQRKDFLLIKLTL